MLGTETKLVCMVNDEQNDEQLNVAILPSCQFLYESGFYCIDIQIVWVVKIQEKPQRQYSAFLILLVF